MNHKASHDGFSGDSVTDQLRIDIIRCELYPGSLLVESQLENRYKATRASVRRALKELSLQGFIQPVPRMGHRVTTPTRGDAKQLFELRALLEPWTARQAALLITSDQVQTLRQLNYHCDPDDAISYSRSLSANRYFHMTIAEIAGNVHVTEVLKGVQDQIMRLLHMGLVTASQTGDMIDDHATLLDAIEMHDPDKSEHIAREQVRLAFLMIDRAIVRALASSEIPLDLSSTNSTTS